MALARTVKLLRPLAKSLPTYTKLMHSSVMIKTILAGTLIAIGGAFGIFDLFYAVVSWGLWGCGVNPFNFGLASALAAAFLTLGNLLWRLGSPPSERSKVWRSCWPMMTFGTFGLWIATIAPACPFMSR